MVTPEKYYRGALALCRTCGARPCLCPTPAAAPADELAPRRRASSGNAIPFALWDYLIADHELTIIESGVYGFLCRETFGRGKHGGAQISLGQLAGGLRISRRAAAAALGRLEAAGLVAREQLTELGSREPAPTHIRVIVPERR